MKPTVLISYAAGVVLATCPLGVAVAVGGEQSNELLKRFFVEAPGKWQEYRALSRGIQGKANSWTKVSSAGTVATDVWVDEIKQSERGAVIVRKLSIKTEGAGVRRPRDNMEKEEILGQNPQYSFALERKPGGLAMTELNLQKPETPLAYNVKPLTEVAFNATSPHFFFQDEPLAEFVKKLKDGSDSLKAAIVERENQKLLRLEINFGEKGKELKGWLLFDPENYWCFLESELVGGKGMFGKVVVKEKNEIVRSGSLPLVKKYSFSSEITSVLGISNSRVGTRDLDLHVATGVPVQEFTLSAFGLPEPVGITWPQPTRWWLWISFAAAGSFCMALFIVGLRRRHQARRPTEAARAAKGGPP